MTTQAPEVSAELVKIDHEYTGLELAVAPAEAHRRLQELQAFVKAVMAEGEDYGKIPGTGEKPCLFKPGAEKLSEIYGFSHRYIHVEAVKDWERGFFYFEYRCELSSRRDGTFVGEGIGSCNSRESKYAGRWVPKKDVPAGMKLDTLQTRIATRWVFRSELQERQIPEEDLEMQWRNKKGGGGQYPVFKIEDQTCFVPNPDPYSLVNTLQKMAAKRAYVMAVIAATRSSAIFTQDLEDLPAEALGKVEEDKPPPPAAAAPAPETAKAKGSKKAADPALDGTPEQRVQFARLSVLIGDAKDLPVLESVGAACVTSRRSQNISDMQRKALAKQWDERKAEIAKGPDASLDEEGRRDWGMSGPPDGPSEEGAK